MTRAQVADYIEQFEELMPIVARTFQDSSCAQFCSLNITMPQFVTLKLIHKRIQPKMTDLSQHLNVTLGNMTSMVNRLIREGFAKRTDDPTDRRIVRVKLTSRGQSLMQKAEKYKRKYLAHILSKMPASDQQILLKILAKLVKAIKADVEGGK